MPKRLYYFRVKAGDELRALQGVDVQAVGLLHLLRLRTFDCRPQGFAVDHKHRPLDPGKLADVFGMSNGRFCAIFTELHERQLIQSAEEYRDSSLALTSGWDKLKLAVLQEILQPFETPLSQVYVVPTLVDDYLSTLVGQRTQRLRGSADASMPPMHAPLASHPSMEPIQAQMSDVRNQISESKSQSFGERETAAARELDGPIDEEPMTWRAYTARCHDVTVWQKRQPAKQSDDAFEAAFEAEFGMTWTVWSDIRHRMDASIDTSRGASSEVV